MPGWSRLTCLFGLPDDASHPDDIIAAALGPVLRAATQATVDTPLPARLASLLRELEHAESALSTAQDVVMVPKSWKPKRPHAAQPAALRSA